VVVPETRWHSGWGGGIGIWFLSFRVIYWLLLVCRSAWLAGSGHSVRWQVVARWSPLWAPPHCGSRWASQWVLSSMAASLIFERCRLWDTVVRHRWSGGLTVAWVGRRAARWCGPSVAGGTHSRWSVVAGITHIGGGGISCTGGPSHTSRLTMCGR